MVKESRFKFKSFDILQDDRIHKVGTDGVLLGAWAAVKGEQHRILDIGTGTGLIALMMAQRSQAIIEAIEPDQLAFQIAQENFSNSPWKDRIKPKEISLQDFNPGLKFDLIISNPPFFHNRLVPPDEKRKTQRHTTSLNFKELAFHCSRLLKQAGSVSVILPVEEGIQAEAEFRKHDLQLSRQTEVYSKPGQSPIRTLQEFRFGNQNVSRDTIVLTDDFGNRSAAYSALTTAFYL